MERMSARDGTEWRFSPAGCSWRNGLAERAIGLAKSTMNRVIGRHELLNFAELETAMIKIAAILNQRPITVRLFSEDDYHAITPADLLLGKMSGFRGPEEEKWHGAAEEEIPLILRLEKVASLAAAWWKDWVAAAFPLLCPRQKWRQENRNIATGDIVLLRPNVKIGKGEYRLARVLDIHPDRRGNVRTVTIGLRYRSRARGEALEESRAGLEEVKMAVQRLVVILPREELWEGGLLAPSK